MLELKHILVLWNENYTEVSLELPRNSVRQWRNYGQKQQALVWRNLPNKAFEETLQLKSQPLKVLLKANKKSQKTISFKDIKERNFLWLFSILGVSLLSKFVNLLNFCFFPVLFVIYLLGLMRFRRREMLDFMKWVLKSSWFS